MSLDFGNRNDLIMRPADEPALRFLKQAGDDEMRANIRVMGNRIINTTRTTIPFDTVDINTAGVTINLDQTPNLFVFPTWVEIAYLTFRHYGVASASNSLILFWSFDGVETQTNFTANILDIPSSGSSFIGQAAEVAGTPFLLAFQTDAGNFSIADYFLSVAMWGTT